jgi:RNA polymerase sigma-70 factor (ECF subfamily)
MLNREITCSELDSIGRPADESLLIARLRANENAAYDELVRTHHAPIYHVAFRMLRDSGEASDVTQEVFLKVFRHIDGFRGESSLRTWIFRIAFSEILNRLRWSRRRYLHRTVSIEEQSQETVEGHAPLQIADRGPDPEAELQRKEQEEAFQSALRELSDEHRSVAILRDVQGFSYAEIAEILGISMGTVKSRLARARAELKGRLMPFLSVRAFGE